MKTYFQFSRTVRLGNITFTEGDIEKASVVRKANSGRLSTNGTLIEEERAKVILSNKSIMIEQASSKDKSIVEVAEGDQEIADQFQLCIDHLLSLGFSMDDIAIHRDDTRTRKTASNRPGWIGVKIKSLDEVFVGRNKKPVSLGNSNWISTSTFLRAVESGRALFNHNQF